MSINWKQLSKTLVDRHASDGGSIVPKLPHSEGTLVNLSDDNFCLQEDGRALSSKNVRRFLWENRNHRSVARDKAAFWSVYLPDEDKSVVGVGALVDEDTAKRMGSSHAS